MPLKKYTEFSKITGETLLQDLKNAKAEYQNLKFEHTLKGLANPNRIKFLRREIAMMNTEMKHRELTANNNK
ncbi:MAG: 50S ribosomal protein L29 [Bacteroidota bacterium]|nr:50S ribosomal protein L29 [Bacteroidota bacterium]